jgi:hypothetical protein
VLRGEELNSVLEQAPALAEAIAKGMGRTTGELRALGEAGALSVREIVSALEKSAPEIARQFESLTPTIGGAFQQLGNASAKMIADMDKMAGATDKVAGAIKFTADNLDGFALALAAVASGGIGGKLGAMASAMHASAVAARAATVRYDALGVALATTATQTSVAATAMRGASAVMGALGGPIGILVTALSLGATAWAIFGNSAEEAGKKAFNAKAALDKLKLQEKYGVGDLAEAKRMRDEYASELAGNQSSISPYAYASRNEFLKKELAGLAEYIKAAESLEQNHVTSISATWEKLHQTKQQQRADEIAALDKTYFAEVERNRGNTEAQLKLAEDYQQKLAIINEKYTKKVGAGKTAESEIVDANIKAYQSYGKAIEDLIRIQNKATLAAQDLTAAERVREQLIQSGAWDKLSTEAKAVVDAYVATANAADRAAESEKQWRDASAKAAQEAIKSVEALENKAEALEEEARYYGLADEAIQNTIIARLEERRAIYDGMDGYEDQIALIDREIEARRRLAAASASKSAIDASKKAISDQERAWERFSEDIERSLTDALMRSFESGESFGEAFAKNLKNTFKTMVLKLAVQAVVQPIMGQLGSVMGVSQQGGSSILGMASDGASLLNMSSTPFASGFSQFASSQLGQSFGLSQAAVNQEAFFSNLANGMTADNALFDATSQVTTELTGLGESFASAADFMDSYGGYLSAGLKLAQGDVKKIGRAHV